MDPMLLRAGSFLRCLLQDYGGDSGAVDSQLVGVRQLCASCGAFAALRGDGKVVAWGDPTCGGAWAMNHECCSPCSCLNHHAKPSTS